MSVQPHQQMSVNRALKQEIVSFQATAVPTWSAPFSVFLRNSGGLICHEAILVLTPSAPISGLTGTSAGFPNLNPSPFFITSYDVNVNGITVDTRRGDVDFLSIQTMEQDEARLLKNYECGPYSNKVGRALLNTNASKYYFPLQISLINAANFKILSPSSEIEIKFNMNSLANVVNLGQSGLTGTPVLNWSNAEILLRCTRLTPAIVQNEISQIIKQPKHYLYHRLQYAPYALNSGISNTAITLSTFNGNISHLKFIIRPNDKMLKDTAWTYTKIKEFEIKDSAGTSLTGGRPISDRESRLNHSRYWTKSSYLADAESEVSDSYVYIYSFSADPCLALATGSRLNSKTFTGQEVLNITFNTALTTACTLEIFGFAEATLSHGNAGVKVLNE